MSSRCCYWAMKAGRRQRWITDVVNGARKCVRVGSDSFGTMGVRVGLGLGFGYVFRRLEMIGIKLKFGIGLNLQ